MDTIVTRNGIRMWSFFWAGSNLPRICYFWTGSDPESCHIFQYGVGGQVIIPEPYPKGRVENATPQL